MKKIILSSGKIITYKPMHFWHQIKEQIESNDGKVMNQEIELENLTLLCEFCKKHDIHIMIFYGTLLGAVRDKHFIDHDDDVDVVIPYEEMLKFFDYVEELYSLGFSIVRYDERFLLSIERKEEYIDIYFHVKQGERRVITEMFVYPACMLEERTEMEFMGTVVPCPKDPEAFFEYEYGSTWRTPIRYKSSVPYAIGLAMKSFIKSCMPSKVELYFQRKAGLKKMALFEQKYCYYQEKIKHNKE